MFSKISGSVRIRSPRLSVRYLPAIFNGDSTRGGSLQMLRSLRGRGRCKPHAARPGRPPGARWASSPPPRSPSVPRSSSCVPPARGKVVGPLRGASQRCAKDHCDIHFPKRPTDLRVSITPRGRDVVRNHGGQPRRTPTQTASVPTTTRAYWGVCKTKNNLRTRHGI